MFVGDADSVMTVRGTSGQYPRDDNHVAAAMTPAQNGDTGDATGDAWGNDGLEGGVPPKGSHLTQHHYSDIQGEPMSHQVRRMRPFTCATASTEGKACCNIT